MNRDRQRDNLFILHSLHERLRLEDRRKIEMFEISRRQKEGDMFETFKFADSAKLGNLQKKLAF